MSEVMNVPKGWIKTLLSDSFRLKSGDTKPYDTSKEGLFEVYGGNGITGYTQYLNNHQQNIVIGRVGEYCGSVYLVSKCWITDNALMISEKIIDFDLKYMYFLLKFINLNQYKSETGQPLLNQTVIGNILVMLPQSIKEQQKIAKILSTLDQAIEATQKLIAKEKNIKKGLMHDLLSNGIDEYGKIRTLKTHKYKESELGLIPEKWEIFRLFELGEIITGSTPSTNVEENYDGEMPFIGPVDFKGQSMIVDTEKTVSYLGLTESREIPINTIMTVCIGSTIGKMALSSQISCTNQQINSLICHGVNDYKFIFYNMQQYLLRQLNIEAGLQAVPLVNKSSFSKLILPCPLALEEQKQIADILTNQDKKIEIEEKNLAKLKELKKGLMDDLLSGRVRVKF